MHKHYIMQATKTGQPDFSLLQNYVFFIMKALKKLVFQLPITIHL